jgi:hypothetical protein
MSITVKQFSVNADLDSVLASSIPASRYLGFRIDSRRDEVLLRGSRGPNWMNFGESISVKVISNSLAACTLEVTCTVMFVDVWGRSSALLSNFQTLMLEVLEKRADSDTSVPSFNMYSACRTVFCDRSTYVCSTRASCYASARSALSERYSNMVYSTADHSGYTNFHLTRAASPRTHTG